MALCAIKVISASKFIMRMESTRDHVDLLMSLKHWPLVYAVDMACDVVAHIEVSHPKLANAMWGERRGCFQQPKQGITPEVSPMHEYFIIINNIILISSDQACR